MQRPGSITTRSSFTRHLRLRKSLTCRLRLRSKNRTLCFGGKLNGEGRRRSHERLLRYPNGDTRLIRYPATDSEAEPEGRTETRPSSQLSPLTESTASLKTSDLPSSPAELVRLIRSSSYIKAQNEHRKRIRESYQILETSPWPTSRKVYVLTTTDRSGDITQMYTFRTRLHQEKVTDKLKTMFRGPNFKGEFVQVDRMADGVITFLDQDNAERFRSLVEAEQLHQVEICELDSPELFRGTSEAKAVVVLMHGHDYFPSLTELTTSLKAQQSLD